MQCPVLAIEISESGEHIAVSYNNRMKGGMRLGENKPRVDVSHICLFMNKGKEKQRGHMGTKMDSNILFEKIT